MFDRSFQYYDKIYAQKDYQGEAQLLIGFIEEHLRSSGKRLLDVACGTGHHLLYLKEKYQVEGLDLVPELLEIARQRNPETPFHEGDMLNFNLGYQFDIITCLFSAIGYVKTLENLEKAIGSMTRHLVPGGLLLVEPWFTPDAWKPGGVHTMFIDEPDLKIVRMNTSLQEGRLSYFDFHYLIGTAEGTEHFIERHELGLFEIEETKDSFRSHGLDVSYDEEGITGRGLYIGKKSL